MKKSFSYLFVRLLLSLTILAFLAPQAQQTVLANTLAGKIAYIVHSPTTGDEIRVVNPDGSNDRLVYSTEYPYPEVLTQIEHLAWKPDASELAFASYHENYCSLYEADIYAIRSDGQNYRRVSAPPACGDRAGIPSGTVTVPVSNKTNEMGPFIIYFEGAPGPKSIALSPGDSTDVTFTNVADYGAKSQYAVWMHDEARSPNPNAKVDVVPGAAVRTGELEIQAGIENWGFHWPTYLPDGSVIVSLLSNFTIYGFESDNQDLGWNGMSAPFDLKLGGSHLAWGPTPEVADHFLYVGEWQDSEYNLRTSVFLGTENETEGEVLFDIDPNRVGDYLLGLAWLPDGSGFLYSKSEMLPDYNFGGNIYEYSLETGETWKVTDLTYGFARQMTVSPDGQKIVFEYQQSDTWYEANAPIDLWIIDRDGDWPARFVEGGRSPAWSPEPAPENNPKPVLAGLKPGLVKAGGAGFLLTVSGSKFMDETVIRWNGTALPTTYVSPTTLTAQVTAAQIASVKTASVTVFTPAPGGGESQPQTITVSKEIYPIYLPAVNR